MNIDEPNVIAVDLQSMFEEIEDYKLDDELWDYKIPLSREECVWRPSRKIKPKRKKVPTHRRHLKDIIVKSLYPPTALVPTPETVPEAPLV